MLAVLDADKGDERRGVVQGEEDTVFTAVYSVAVGAAPQRLHILGALALRKLREEAVNSPLNLVADSRR